MKKVAKFRLTKIMWAIAAAATLPNSYAAVGSCSGSGDIVISSDINSQCRIENSDTSLTINQGVNATMQSTTPIAIVINHDGANQAPPKSGNLSTLINNGEIIVSYPSSTSSAEGIWLLRTDSASITNNGAINIFSDQTSAVGIDIDASTNTTIKNGGIIESHSGTGQSAAIYLTNGSSISTLENTGSMSSDGGVIASGQDINTIINSGTMSTIYDTVRAGNILQIRNTGTLESVISTALIADKIDTITNDGVIQGGNSAISSTSIIKTVNNGEISADNYTIRAQSIGEIYNHGTISSSTDDAFHADSATKIYNDGTINADNDGFDIDSVQTFINKGTVNATYFDGFDAENQVTLIDNSGIINAGDNGLELNGADQILNSGTITADYNGIYAYGTISSVENSGSIVGGDAGVYANKLNHLINSGLIKGGDAALIIDPYGANDTSDAGEITIRGGNARFDGTVAASGATVTVENGAQYTLKSGDQFILAPQAYVDWGNAGSFGTFTLTDFGQKQLVSGNFVSHGKLIVTEDSTESAHIAGNLILASDGELTVKVADAQTHGRIQVKEGNVSLDGKLTVDVTQEDKLSSGEKLEGVITTDSEHTITGQFASVSDNSALFDFRVENTGHSLNLNITQGIRLSDTFREEGADGLVPGGITLDQLLTSSGAPADMQQAFTELGKIEDKQQLAKAAAQLLPGFNSEATLAALNTMQAAGKVIAGRTAAGMASGDLMPEKPFTVWAKRYRTWSTQGSKGLLSGYNGITDGMILGFEKPMKQSLAGVAVNWFTTNVDSGDALNQQQVLGYGLTAYGAFPMQSAGLNISWQLGGYKLGNKGQRIIPVPGAIAQSKYDALGIMANLSAAHPVQITDDLTISPKVSYQYSAIWQDRYTETGAGSLNLNVRGQHSKQSIGAIGADLSYTLPSGNQLLANLQAGHDFGAEDVSVTSSFVGGGPAFTVSGRTPGKTVYQAGAQFIGHLKDGLTYKFSYDLSYRDSSDNLDQTVGARLDWTF